MSSAKHASDRALTLTTPPSCDRPASSAKKGGDKGIDGLLSFHDGGPAGSTKQIVFAFKAGGLVPAYVRELRGTIDREEAQIGVLLSFETPSGGMRAEAASAGFYTSPWGSSHPRLQLITVGQLLEGKQIDYPHLTGEISRTGGHRESCRRRTRANWATETPPRGRIQTDPLPATE